MNSATVFCGVIVLGLALVGFKKQGELLERANPTGVRVPDRTISYNEQVQDFFPLSSRELLFIQGITDTANETPKVVEGNWVRTMRVFRVDLITKKVKRDARLEKAISEWFWTGFTLSPDGKWLLCHSGDKKWPNKIVEIKTGKVSKAPLVESSSTIWLPSGKALLTTVFPKPKYGSGMVENAPEPYAKAFAFPRTNPAAARPYAFVYGKTPDPKLTALPYWGSPVVVTPDRRLLTLSSYQATAEHPWHQVIRINEFAIEDTKLVHRHTYKIEPPDAAVYNRVVRINPQGTRVLWQGNERAMDSSQTWSFSTSNLDGSDRHDYGRIAIPSANEPYRPEIVHEEYFGAEWMPDGKTICFIANRKIYTIEDGK